MVAAVFAPASWKLGAELAAAGLLTPKLKVSEGAETELEVEAAVAAGAPRPNVRVFAVAGLSGSDCEPPAPKLKGAMAAVEADVETAGRLLDVVEAGVLEMAGRLKVTVAVLVEVGGFVVSDEEGGEEMVPNEKLVEVVEVTELSEAVGTEVAAVVSSAPSELAVTEEELELEVTVAASENPPAALS